MIYLVGEYGRCLAYAEACGLEGGEWLHIQDAEALAELGRGSHVTLLCTTEEYWDMSGYWHEDAFASVVEENDIWFRHVATTEA